MQLVLDHPKRPLCGVSEYISLSGSRGSTSVERGGELEVEGKDLGGWGGDFVSDKRRESLSYWE